MKKNSVILFTLLCILIVALCACTADKYTVTFEAGEGSGTAPTVEDKEAGEIFALPDNPFVRDGYDFSGWSYGDEVYASGAEFTMPAENVIFTAKWSAKSPADPTPPDDNPNPEPPVTGQPAFSQSEYNYDRLGGEDLEIPLDLEDSNIYYVELDGETLWASDYSYDEETHCLVIKSEIILALGNGEFSVRVITDSPEADVAECTIIVDNSVKTTFDSVTTKEFRYGYDKGITFSVDFNGTTISSLKQGDYLVDASQYEQTAEGIFLKSSLLKNSCKEASYEMLLSNNDQYSFSVKNNIIFFTDYDRVTIHDTTSNNTGLNSLYQYSDNVEIVDSKEGMEGRVLRFTPNTEDVLYDCHSIYTLRGSDFDATWYNVGYQSGKYYAFSFDYMTEGTSTGTFFFGSRDTSWKFDLLLGAENDGVLHHFQGIASKEEIANGTWVRAFFKGADGGCIYFDNFTVVELDSRPSVESGEYNMSGDYSVECNLDGFDCDFYLNDVLINSYVSVEGSILTIQAEALSDLEVGQYQLVLKTDLFEVSGNISVIDNRQCAIADPVVNYDANKAETVRLYGSFDEGVSLVSVKQLDKHYNGGYGDNWDFSQCDTEKNYASLLNVVSGLDNAGYIEISAAFADLFWGSTEFDLTFNTGKTIRMTLNSSVVLASNFDDVSILGYYDGSYAQESPINSGMGGAVMNIAERSEGNKALFVTSTQNAHSEGKSLFTMKFMPHVWDWVQVNTNENNQYRVTFTYKLTNFADREVYFYIMDKHESNVPNTFFGSGYEVVDVGGWNELRWYLIADGEEHVFDTGWFCNTSATCDLPRLMKVVLPDFSESSGKCVMVDDLRIFETSDAAYFLSDLAEYQLGGEGIVLNTQQTLISAKIDDVEVALAKTSSGYVLDKAACNALSMGSHELVVIGERGTYKGSFNIIDNLQAELSETSKKIVRGQDGVSLSGVFDSSLSVVSVKRQGTLHWDNTLTNTAVRSDGSLPTSYVTLSTDGITLSKALLDQVYGTMSYTVTLSNSKEISFSLTSNVMYFSNWDETYVQEETALESGSGNVASCQDTSMISIVDVGGNKKYKYVPTDATLGHSQGGFSGGRDNGCLTFSNSNYTGEWWYFDFPHVETVIVFFDYEIVADGKSPNYEFIYRDNAYQYHTVAITGNSGTFSVELPASTLERFYIHCSMSSKEEAEGTYMLIDNFGFGIKEGASGEGNNRIYNDHYDVTDGMESLKVAGQFESGVSIASITRSAPRMNASGSLDPAFGTPAAVDASYIEIAEDGLTLKAELLKLAYGISRFDITLSNGVSISIVLNSNVLLYVDYDNIMFFDSTSKDDSNAITEWTQDTNMLEIVEEDGNKKMVYTPEDTVRGDAISNANNGALNFSHNGRNSFWYLISYPTVGQITISFDYDIDLGEQTDNYYSVFWYSAVANSFLAATLDVNSNHYSVTFDAVDLVLFRIYCPVSDASLYAGTSMSIDNFKIVLN